MRITVKVVPGSKNKEIKRQPDGTYKVKLLSPPIKGKANKELIDIISKEFSVKKSLVSIVKGERTREKIIEIGSVK